MPSASTANTRPPATTGPASSREPPPAPAPMPERQATVDRVGGVQVLHGVRGLAAGLRPVGVAHRRRQDDVELGQARVGAQLVLDQQHRLALARQRRRPGSRPARCPRRSRRGRAAAAVSAPRRESPLMSSPGPARPRSPAAARRRAAAARAARRPPCSARPGCAARLVEGAGADRDQRQELAGLVAPGCARGGQGLQLLLERRPGRRCRAAARPRAGCRARAGSGRLRPPAARPSSAARAPAASFWPSLASASLQPGQRGEARLALGRQGRELGGRLGVVARQQRLLGRGEARRPRPRAPAAAQWSQPTLAAVPTTISTATPRTMAP